MDYAEALTKRLFEHILPKAQMVYRPSQSKGEFDFYLHHEDGRISAVEVTSSPDPTLHETWNQILHKRKGGPVIKTNLCKKSWYITVSSNARIDLIRKNVDRYLSAVEQAGVSQFAAADANPHVRNIVNDLGVIYGSALPGAIASGFITFGLPGPPGKFGAETAVDVAEGEAWKTDNRKKLGSYVDGEKYLAIYAPITSLAAFALWMREPPPTVVNLPPEISHIWIFTDEDIEEHEFVVWRSSADARWRKLRGHL